MRRFVPLLLPEAGAGVTTVQGELSMFSAGINLLAHSDPSMSLIELMPTVSERIESAITVSGPE